jgi:hypothetical protein
MNWYYAENNQQRGPVSEAELSALVQAGRVTPATLVWNQGLTTWQPYGQVAPLGPNPAAAPGTLPPAAAGAGGMVCVECGRTVSAEEAIRIADSWVCAACKPVFLQRLSEGAALPGLGFCTEEQLLQRDYDSPVGSCIGRGWRTYLSYFGPLLGTTLLVGLAIMAVNMVPYLGFILGYVFNGPLTGGLWAYVIRRTREQETNLQHAFSGFSPLFGQLLLGHLVATILASLPVAPGLVILLVGLFAGITTGAKSAMVGLMVLGGALTFAGIIASYYLTTLWLYVLPLIADKHLNFWPAMQFSRKMVRKHFWLNLGLVLLVGLIMAVPLLVLGGVVVTVLVSCQGEPSGGQIVLIGVVVLLGALWMLFCVPWSLCSMAHRYNDMFRDLAPRA